MAFLTSSPLMSPDGFVMMSGVLGFRFAAALTAASLAIGLASGFITHLIDKRTGYLRDQTRYEGKTQTASCSCSSSALPASDCQPAAVSACSAESCDNSKYADELLPAGCGAECGEACCAALPKPRRFDIGGLAEKLRMRELAGNFVTLGLKQILLYFSIFVGVGYIVNSFVPASIISVLFGARNIAAVPLASLIGLPLYLTTESGIPIIQSMLRSGASEGAMLAFIITGSATSAWVIAGLSTIMRKRAMALYIAYVLLGGILAGYLYDIVLMFIK
jgi:uncharacterized membrane protein YraQ (UPF0718 family)